MSPKGNRHESIRCELAFHMSRQAPATLRVAAEAQLNLADDAYVVPDILVYPAATKVYAVRGPSALLVVEIADSSLAYDLDTKAGISAACGVREYWVVNARTLERRVHRQPSQPATMTLTRCRPTPGWPLDWPRSSQTRSATSISIDRPRFGEGSGA